MNHENLTKDTVQTILNEIFLLDKKINKKTLETFIVNRDIKFGYCWNKNLSNDNNLTEQKHTSEEKHVGNKAKNRPSCYWEDIILLKKMSAWTKQD